MRVWDGTKPSVWKKTKPSRQPAGVSGKETLYQKSREAIAPRQQNSGEGSGDQRKASSKTRCNVRKTKEARRKITDQHRS